MDHLLHGKATGCSGYDEHDGRECVSCMVGLCVHCWANHLTSECPGIRIGGVLEFLVGAGLVDYRNGTWIRGRSRDLDHWPMPDPPTPTFEGTDVATLVLWEAGWITAKDHVLHGKGITLGVPDLCPNRAAAVAYFMWRLNPHPEREYHENAHVVNMLLNNARGINYIPKLPDGTQVLAYV